MTKTITFNGDSVFVKSNYQTRPLFSLMDATDAERAEFDYVGEEESYDARLFRYRGATYDSHEFEYRLAGWGGETPSWVTDAGFTAWQTESAFSAVLINLVQETDGDSVIVGYAHW